MEISRILRLDRAGKDGRAPIHLRICWRGNKVRFSSGEKVVPTDWDSRKEQVMGKVKFSHEINNRLDIYELGIREFIAESENKGVVVTEAMVRAVIERIRITKLGHKPRQTSIAEPLPDTLKEPTISAFIQQYIRERSADRSESWRESIELVGGHLEAFRPGLTWSDCKLATLNNFKLYLQDELHHSDATLQAYVGLLRGMLKYASRYDIAVPSDWMHLEGRKFGHALMPELKASELKQIRQLTLGQARDISLDDLEETRWYFLVACGTGLRHSDLWQLQNPRLTTIEGVPCMEIFQQKTKTRVSVPLSPDTYQLLRNPISRDKPLGLSTYNKSLKLLGKQAGLTRSVRVGSYYRGQLLTEELPLHDVLNSHIARRTFATQMTAGGMPTRTLQVLMGHSSISSTERYSQVSSSTIVLQAREVWDRVDKR